MIEAIQQRLAGASSRPGPKYQVLRDAIIGAISSGDWVPGLQLPTEAELARMLPYSLGTVQKAYGELVRDGLVQRARGRGTFVSSLQREMAAPWHCRFLADDGTILPIYPRLLGHEPASEDPRWERLFGAEAKLIRIDRAISINHEFEVISRFFTPRLVAKSLLRLPRAKFEAANFKAVLLRELSMPIRRITQTITMADRRTWRQLGIKSRPHLSVEATAYSTQGNVAYFQEFYIPANSRKLLFDSELRF